MPYVYSLKQPPVWYEVQYTFYFHWTTDTTSLYWVSQPFWNNSFNKSSRDRLAILLLETLHISFKQPENCIQTYMYTNWYRISFSEIYVHQDTNLHCTIIDLCYSVYQRFPPLSLVNMFLQKHTEFLLKAINTHVIILSLKKSITSLHVLFKFFLFFGNIQSVQSIHLQQKQLNPNTSRSL